MVESKHLASGGQQYSFSQAWGTQGLLQSLGVTTMDEDVSCRGEPRPGQRRRLGVPCSPSCSPPFAHTNPDKRDTDRVYISMVQ